ncbi:MAG: toll/interleukin-1 receptor domain-containing protein [Pedosphaera sp.]|nr:toll/interleukin-1 receptor domain-containing protein [Pedosphaera sp.]
MPIPLPLTTPAAARVTILRHRDAAADEMLSRTLEVELTKAGFAAYVDRAVHANLDWAREIAAQLKASEAVVVLVSPDSAGSEFFVSEVETAREAAEGDGKPRLIEVRIGTFEEVPDLLSSLMTGTPRFAWHGIEDNTKLIRQLVDLIREVPSARGPMRLTISKGLRLSARTAPVPRPVVQPAAVATLLAGTSAPLQLDSFGGAVPLQSSYYMERSADREMQNSLIRYDSIILLKGARQIGKTSMLARGLQFARERGAKVALTDFQKFNQTNLENVGVFYLSLAESLADQLDLAVLPADTWDERRGPNSNFERFVRRAVLEKLNAPLVWGLDEVDRLFTTPYGSEVFGLFRSWHNERALDPSGPWVGLTLAIAYATEAHVFITDMNQSPFNVGTRLALEDFSIAQVTDLNMRYGSPLKTPQELARFFKVTGGHPFLSRRGLYELAARKMALAEFETVAVADSGFFGEHLRRMLVLLARDPNLTDVIRGVLHGQECPTPESFYRLRSAGLITGDSQGIVRMRCQVYGDYLRQHLMG